MNINKSELQSTEIPWEYKSFLFLFLVVAVSVSLKEICSDWEWLEKNLMDTLSHFDDEDQISDFVRCKIESLVAHSQPNAALPEGVRRNIPYFKVKSGNGLRLIMSALFF